MKGKYFPVKRGGEKNLNSSLVSRIIVVILFVFLLSNGWGGPGTLAHAKTCIPEAFGVPGLSGPPDWWTTGQSLSLAYKPEDPRWRGAVSRDYGMGSTSEAEFRGLYKTVGGVTYMYLSWYIKVAPSITIDDDALYVGFYSPGAVNGTIVKITLKNTSTDVGGIIKPKPQIEGAITYYTATTLQGNGTTNWSTVATQSGITDHTRVWIKGTNPYYWVVQMQIPINTTNGINITNTNSFRMWYYIQVAAAGPIIPYTLPRTTTVGSTAFIYHEVALTPTYPDPVTWEEAGLQNPESVTSCQNGISITASKIGTTGTPSSKINLFSANTFFAKPINYSGVAVPANKIKATFRIANWGSSVGDLTSASWQVIPGGLDVQDTGGIAAASGSEGNITFNWTLTTGERCPFVGQSGVPTATPPIPGDSSCTNPTPTRRLHQCMAVKLTGPSLDFIRDSVYRNMDFVGASTFSRNAEISVVGLPALTSSDRRDVYLYLEKRNMPAFTNIGEREMGRENTLKMRAGGSDISTGTDETPSSTVTNFDEIAKTAPTYVVHAYHDTGETVKINGVKHPLLIPQTSFGYFVNHEGGIEGWQASLKGANLIKLAPYWYKIAVPNNGVSTVTTTIKAIDPKFAISARLGMGLPHGTFDSIVDPGLSLNVGLEYLLSRYFSFEAVFGYHKFADAGLLGSDQDIFQFSGNLRYFYPITTRFRTFINGGAGLYKLDPGDTKLGFNVGAGFDFYLTTQFALEAAYNYHTVNTEGDNINFSTIQGGFRFRF